MINKSENFHFQKYRVDLYRRAFYRGIRLQIKEVGVLVVTVPRLMPYKTILEFLEQKQSWIQLQQNKLSERMRRVSETRSRIGFQRGQVIPILGSDCIVEHLPGLQKKIFWSRYETNLRAHIPLVDFQEIQRGRAALPFREIQRSFVKFYHRESEKYLVERVKTLADQTGLIPSEVKFRNQSTRWGSCSAKGVLNLNRKLFSLGPDAIDYVVIHELCHLRHLNHSQRFWDLVKNHCPNYETFDAELTNQSLTIHCLDEVLIEPQAQSESLPWRP